MSKVKRPFLTAFDSPGLTANVTDSKEGKIFKQLAIVPVVFVSGSFSTAMEQEETVFLDGVLQVPIQRVQRPGQKAPLAFWKAGYLENS